MAKPWGRYELGYLNHPKFVALNGNAIALWWEGKNYCDKYLTDGLIPKAVVKTFRFAGPKTIALLTTSCGPKGDGTMFAPLWEHVGDAFVMHSYLDHNDCREVVMSRMGAAAERRQAEKQRKSEWRRRKADTEAEMSRGLSHGTRDGTGTSLSRSMTETTTETETKEERTRAATPRPSRPPTLIAKRRMDAAWEGPRGLYVPEKLHRQFVELRNGDAAALWTFYGAVADAYAAGARKNHEPGADMFKFWSARYEEKWPATPAEKPQPSSAPVSRSAKDSPYARTGTEGA